MYSSGYSSAVGAGTILAGFGILILFIWIIAIATSIVMVISMWKIFKKAGKNGWEAIIPIYNMITLVQITDKPLWYIIFFFFPIAPIVVYMPLAEKFGKQSAFAVLLLLVPIVGFPMLAFGKNTYGGAPANSAAAETPVANPVAEPIAPATSAASADAAAVPVVESEAPVAPVEPIAPVAPAMPVAPEPVAPVEPAAPVAPEPIAPASAPATEPVAAPPVVQPAPTAEPAVVQPAPDVAAVSPAAPVPPANPVPPVQPMQ